MRRNILRSTPLAAFLLSRLPRVLGTSLLPALVAGCAKEPERILVPRTQSLAELRTVKRGVTVTPPAERERVPFPHERLVDGETVSIAEGGLAWVRRDGGATLLVAGPATLVLERDDIDVRQGTIFVDALAGLTTEIRTPRGTLHLADVRASLVVRADGATSSYVLKGAVRAEDGTQAGPGEQLSLEPGGKVVRSAVRSWDDWTGGLATTDQAAQPAPFGVGTIGARTPGATGQPRFPLAIQKMEVKVTIDHDFALTEVEQVFFNPSTETVEGIYSFRTPHGATLHRFGVDRDDGIVWGRVKEKAAAAAQYQANVYQGSTEDPALLEWVSPGVYKARLYPIKGGETRRVVTRYGEWLSRNGERGERRLYTYPMAAEGSEGTLPKIEELTISVNLAAAAAKETRVGMRGIEEGQSLTVRAHDLTPRADFALELFDDGLQVGTAYRAPHKVDLDMVAFDERDRAVREAKPEEAYDYLLVPFRPSKANEPAGGIDLAIVVDASAATDAASLAVARSMTGALLSHLGKEDRAVVWAADASLRPVAEGSDHMAAVDAVRREAITTGLARVDRGGATDLGAVLATAASQLDGSRRGAVVYIGDGRATVGELSVGELRDRLGRLPRPVRLFTVGVGDEANMAVLKGISRGAFAEQVSDAYGAAQTALRLLEEAERPVWLGASVDLGPGVDRIYPRELGAISADETAMVVGRIGKSTLTSVTVRGPGGESTQRVVTMPLGDDGDLRRRWAEGRLVQLLDEGAGRAAVVEVGSRFGIITPFTSLYVPTRAEVVTERRKQQVNAHNDERDRGRDVDQLRHEEQRISELTRELQDVSKRTAMARDDAEESRIRRELATLRGEDEEPPVTETASSSSDMRLGGTGTRAKAEEGSMGNASPKSGGRFAVAAAPAAAAPESPALEQKQKEASDYGAIGAPRPGAATESNAPVAPWGRDDSAKDAKLAERSTVEPSAPGGPAGGAAMRPPAQGGASLDGLTNAEPAKAARGAPPPPPAATATATPSPVAGPMASAAAVYAPSDGDGKNDADKSGRGGLWGGDIGDTFGAGGLGLSGIGEGGGGTGEGIGLGNIGTLGKGSGTGTGQGFGAGAGRDGGAHKTSAPALRVGALSVTGRLPPEVIQRIARINFGRFRLCYENGLKSNPSLAGKVVVRFVIAKDGSVSSTANGGSDLSDASVVGCIVRSFSNLSFPAPDGGTVTVSYPLVLAPGDGGASAAPPTKEELAQQKKEAEQALKDASEKAKILNEAKIAAGDVALRLGDVGHRIRLCAPGASLPLDERVVLWRERLSAANGSAVAVRDVFLRALAGCEAPTWRERNRLLYMMLDSLKEVRKRVELWRLFAADRGVADVIYQGVVMRVQTATELKELHAALGLKKIDPTLLTKELATAKTPGERAVKLKTLVFTWPDDLDLALKLLDAYEDLGDLGAARGLARELRRRGDANARLRTAVGELYFRLAKKPGGNDEDASEARRTFGEIVEFSPHDPVARRRLGDLLRAHGLYDEAFRQYETLGKLTPDDTTVPLLLAAAAQGMGRTEESIRWTEKASAANSPDGGSGSGRTSRAFASVFLAWARDEATKAGRKDEADRLRERARRLTALDLPTAAGATPRRVVLSWSHPELHPVLWSDALGASMPASDGDPLMGIAQVMMPGSRTDAIVEIRFEKEDAELAARLGAEAVITLLIHEGSDDERIVRLPVVFSRPDVTLRKFHLTSTGLEEI